MAHQTHAQQAKAATRVLPEEDPEFQIAPMIDILLVLLVFFMSIATEQVMQVNKEVILPMAKEAKEPDASDKKKSELMLNLTWSDIGNNGSIIVDDKTVDASVLPELIKRKKDINPDLRVIIRADKRAKYAYVRSIMVAMGAAGVPNVTFSAVDKEMEGKP
ncbi:MAG: biopolymer transporter ExbD [Chthoniobacteraceae bacterium]